MELTAQERLAGLTPMQLREMPREERAALIAAANAEQRSAGYRPAESDPEQDRLQALHERRQAAILASAERKERWERQKVSGAAFSKLYKACMSNFLDRDRCLEMIAAYEVEFGESGLDDDLRRTWARNDEIRAGYEADFQLALARATAIKQAEADRRAAAAAELEERDRAQAEWRAARDRKEAEKRDQRRRRKNVKARADVQGRLDRADRIELEVEFETLAETDEDILARIETEFTSGFDVQEEQAEHLRRGRQMYSILAGRVLQRHWGAVLTHLEANPTARRRDGIEAVGGDPRTGSDAAYKQARGYNDLAKSRNRAAYIAGAEHRRDLARERGEIE